MSVVERCHAPQPEERVLAVPGIVAEVGGALFGEDLLDDDLLDGREQDDGECRRILERIGERPAILVV
jgi:hypothetical protein